MSVRTGHKSYRLTGDGPPLTPRLRCAPGQEVNAILPTPNPDYQPGQASAKPIKRPAKKTP